MTKRNELLKGFTDTIPLGISVSIYGIVYGVLAGKAGLSIFAVIAMSSFVFAGASQMAAVQMLALGSGPISVVLTIFIINLRHYLLAASIAPYLKDFSTRIKMVCAYFMTDESYAVTYNHFQKNEPSPFYFLGSGLNIYLFWGASGVLGYLSGSIIPPQVNYVFDFAFAAAFIGILVPMIKDMPVLVTVIASAAISIAGCLYIPGKWYILIAGIGASLVGYAASSVKGPAGQAALEKGEVLDNE
ncbi:MAG: AzlC family ABC transporter permease [Clostridiales bacterium]|jgi:4-azaleucine resistance transporter AzlC|nr:AzlC family ABC transporter permease [Eubacteriales bacterium]MDH7566715.1 AzlC family ABC transporter permease [Clostridiales bacterium]